jgi:hypothetical protein
MRIRAMPNAKLVQAIAMIRPDSVYVVDIAYVGALAYVQTLRDAGAQSRISALGEAKENGIAECLRRPT